MDWTKRTQKTPGINALDSGDRLENALTPGTACLTSGTDWGSLELQGLLKRRRPGNSRPDQSDLVLILAKFGP